MLLIILKYQSTFVLGRLITDNVITSFEIVHSIRTCNKGKKRAMSIKLDMSEAYYRVEQYFLQPILFRLRFDSRLTAVVMHCVSTPQFSFILTGRVYSNISAKKGLRQGCPLSPYSYLLCAVGFLVLIRSNRKLAHQLVIFSLHMIVSCSIMLTRRT